MATWGKTDEASGLQGGMLQLFKGMLQLFKYQEMNDPMKILANPLTRRAPGSFQGNPIIDCGS